MIEDADLKRRFVGGAMISEKHAGFIINTGNATCHDVVELIDIVKSEVNKKFAIELETEVQFVGENDKELKIFED